MASDTTDDRVPLAEAVLQWSDPDLVEAAKATERRYIPHELNEFYGLTSKFRFRILPDAEIRKPGGEMGSAGPPSLEWIMGAWKNLEADFRRRLTTGIYLRGVQIAPSPQIAPEPIPQAWASDAKFDIARGVIEVVGRRYAAVTASKIPPPAAKTTEVVTTTQEFPAITEASARMLSDDEVFLLLEEYAGRIVENDAKFFAPGKISVMPMIKRKMKYRSEQDDLATSLAEESRVLGDWISGKLPSHQAPTAKAIANSLRTEYASLRARSKGMKT